ncbi:MAG: 50S ribosomal protein L29 [candidate division Zixibacteria bacterium]|nr:50S ribosomal protein L29 [candidate division Zixibacteria bacterium]
MFTASQIRDMTIDEIKHQLSDMEDEYFNLRFRRSFQQLENPLKIRTLRRDIARIRTILHEHEIGVRELHTATEDIVDGSVEEESK